MARAAPVARGANQLDSEPTLWIVTNRFDAPTYKQRNLAPLRRYRRIRRTRVDERLRRLRSAWRDAHRGGFAVVYPRHEPIASVFQYTRNAHNRRQRRHAAQEVELSHQRGGHGITDGRVR